LYLLPGLHFDISASHIRDRIRNQAQPAADAQTPEPALLPPPVLEYIRAHGLYR
jgi:nicotinic acid mononucleotide adenylyltransferase